MKSSARVSIIAGLGLLAAAATAPAADSHHAEPAAAGSVKLSPAVLELLRAEMREIAGGMQSMSLAIAIGDWNSVRDTSTKIQSSYIMNRKLSAAQQAELEHALPELFRHMDAQFHQQAGKAAAAAAAHDAEAVVFQYARMLESCTACHAAFARPRFRGFEPEPATPHHH